MAVFRWLAVSTILVAVLGCASIPPAAPALSAELGGRISAIEQAHIALLRKFFDQKRDQVDRFIEEQWSAAFVQEAFEGPAISKAWETIVKENDPAERHKFFALVGPRLQSRINSKRLELIRPLEDLERRIEAGLKAEYDQARAINHTLTTFLQSASKLDATRDSYLSMVGLPQDRWGGIIDETDAICAELVSQAGAVRDTGESARVFVEKINALQSKI